MKYGRWISVYTIALIILILLPRTFAGQEDSLRFIHPDNGENSFSYTPPVNGMYGIYAWSVNDDSVNVSLSLREGEEEIASGSGSEMVCEARLASNHEYMIDISTDDDVLIEVARDAKSRCRDKAIEIEENYRREKQIVDPGDVHWYTFVAEDSNLFLITCEPEEDGLQLNALLIDDSGRVVSEFDALPGGACRLCMETEKDRRYYVRVFSPNEGTGGYGISTFRLPASEIARVPVFDAELYRVSRNRTLDLRAHIQGDVYMYTVSEPGICTVSAEGIIKGIHTGTVEVTAYGFASQASCIVEVINVPIESINILGSVITVYEGDEADAAVEVQPVNASSDLLIFTIEDSDIASVDSDGVVAGLCAGETILHVASRDGTVSDTATVRVLEAPQRGRVLLIGEENYPASVNTSRPGTGNGIFAMASALEELYCGDEKYSVDILLDCSRTELIEAIRDVFANAKERDNSVIYISSHGEYLGGMCFLQLTDGMVLPVETLAAEISRIPGNTVLLLDACASGGAIACSEENRLYTRKIVTEPGASFFPNTNCLVLCSTAANQESYRFVADGGEKEEMVTVFSKAICEALKREPSGLLAADIDADGRITFAELYRYVRQSVLKDMERIGKEYSQSVQANEPMSPLVLFQ